MKHVFDNWDWGKCILMKDWISKNRKRQETKLMKQLKAVENIKVLWERRKGNKKKQFSVKFPIKFIHRYDNKWIVDIHDEMIETTYNVIARCFIKKWGNNLYEKGSIKTVLQEEEFMRFLEELKIENPRKLFNEMRFLEEL